MAIWKTYRIADAVTEIGEEKFVLPVIQRSLVWTEEKMELLFDTLLKGDSFGGIMAIEEEKETKPLFNYRPFTKDGNFIPSRQIEKLLQQQFFVIDGQQRLQSFYIGLKGSINGKVLFFDLFSNYNSEYEFKFGDDETALPKQIKEERPVQEHFWYETSKLLNRLKDTNDDDQVADEIILNKDIREENKKNHIKKNVRAFYKNIITAETLGISKVVINKSLAENDNRQRIVEMFRRLNDGGTRLSSFELVASILKGFDWRMEGFLKDMLDAYQDIGLSQDNLIKLIFLLQDNHSKEMTSLEVSDANFAIENTDRIKATIKSLKNFLEKAEVLKFYQDSNSSFIPLFFIAYHLFHKQIDDNRLEHYFDNYDSGNPDFLIIKKWLYTSLMNGVFRSRGAGWVPYKTGIRRILDIIKDFKNKEFPINELFEVYKNSLNSFLTSYSSENLNQFDNSFLFFLMYDCKPPVRVNDIDHIMPKSILEKKGFEWNKINSIKNYQLIDYGTNRGNKSDKPFAEWINNSDYVKDKFAFIKLHLIPENEELWNEDKFLDFRDNRADLIEKKIKKYFP